MTDDYDSPWKEILEQYFEEFMAFFFPAAHAGIDWSRGYEFLDKEFQQITKDADSVRRYVDKLARVWMQDGSEAWGLIHTDIQNLPEKGFPERMYIYNYRIFDRYRRPAVSFAVLGSAPKNPKKRAVDLYERNLWGCELRFRFPVVNLSDYAGRTEELKQSQNPFAVVVLTHLLTRQTAPKGKRHSRRREKLEIVRHLYQKGFSRQDVISLFRFIDWVMALPEKDENLFWEDLSTLEKEEKMPYVTSVERIGFKRGFLEGTKQGEKQGEKRGEKRGEKTGQVNLLARLIARKFRSTVSKESPKLKKLDAKDLVRLGEKLFVFETLEEVHAWIDKCTGKKNGA
ncbi:MAG: DUF4351 domain-containing protein [Desulfobacterales bacterium]